MAVIDAAYSPLSKRRKLTLDIDKCAKEDIDDEYFLIGEMYHMEVGNIRS